jgi:hypothetical protein
MIVEPQNQIEAIVAGMMQRITADNLFTIDCSPVTDHVKDREGCMFNIQWSSGALEQLSAYLSECIEIEEE